MLSRVRHWSPRYVAERIAWAAWERRTTDAPWISPHANQLLEKLLVRTDIGLEFGSGRSTAWLAKRVAHLTSVEDHRDWHRLVEQRLREQNVANVSYVFAPEPRAGDAARTSEYVRVAERFANESLGFALVDGSAREYCAEALIPKIARGGLLVIDDTHGWFDNAESRAAASRRGQGPKNDVWRTVGEALRGWRQILVTSSIKDTTFFIRPNP
jgi:predicted O-methyltransferase YrrM